MPYNNYNSSYPAYPSGAPQGYPYQFQPNMGSYPLNTSAPQYQQMPTLPPPLMPQQQARQNNMILDWVQGKEAASAYYVEPGRGAILMDINRHTFYLTSKGEDGIPRPLQIFDYYQRPPESQNYNDKTDYSHQLQNYTDKTDYVPRSEYNELERRIKELEEMVTSNSQSQVVARPEGHNNV